MATKTHVANPGRYKWVLLALLWFAFFFNQADRQIFAVVLPLIKADLKLSDAELGLVASVLIWTYGALVPIAGFTGDRFSRKSIIGGSLLFWSVATLFTGMCSSITQFIILRGVATGGGEAFYAPSANALLSNEHKQKTSFALAIHQTAVYCGIILSGLIAGYIAQQYGWRNSFYLFGVAGVLVALLVFTLIKKDAPAVVVERISVMQTARIIVKKPTVLLLTGAFACMVFVNVGYLTWMPSLLVSKFGLSLTAAGFSSMFYHHLGAFIGVISGGALSDRLSVINPRNRLLIQACALLCGAPFIYGIGQSGSLHATYLALFVFGIFRGIYDGSIYASLYEVISPVIRSSASGLMLMFAFLAGAFSPYILGLLKPTLGLAAGISWLWLSYFTGSCLLFIASFVYFKKDKVTFVGL